MSLVNELLWFFGRQANEILSKPVFSVCLYTLAFLVAVGIFNQVRRAAGGARR